MFKKTRPDNADADRDEQRGESDPSKSGVNDSSAPRAERGREAELDSAGDEKSSARETELDKLRRESEENLQNWKRATADYQNLRRRLQSDIDAASQRSKQPLLLDLLLVLDYLEMALKTPVNTTEGKNLSAGVELTRSVLLRTIERENVRAVPEGGKFDAAVHQAVERVETSEHEAGTILGTLRRGYTCGGQVIRPAQLRVAVELPTERDESSESAADTEGRRGTSSSATES